MSNFWFCCFAVGVVCSVLFLAYMVPREPNACGDTPYGACANHTFR
jgi:hypothetical protein